MVGLGEIAPDFTTTDSDGRSVHLAELRGKQKVVLYFFPKCFTPGCDIEAGKFRDEFPKFQEKGTLIFGVSGDDAETAKKFREHFRLPFPILPDPQTKLIDLYGVKGSFGGARRVTFLIGLDGKVENLVEDRLPEAHIKRSLERLGAKP